MRAFGQKLVKFCARAHTHTHAAKFVVEIFTDDFIHCIYIIKKLHAHTSREFILVLRRHGSIARVTTISGMQALCTVSSQRV